MAARLIGNAQIATSDAPLRAVRPDAPPSGARLSQQMCELMPKRAVDFVATVFTQSRIERDPLLARIGPPGSTSETMIPLDNNFSGER